MANLFKILATFSAFIGICAFGEWIANNALWLNWILIPVALYVAFIATFGNHFEEYGKEEK